MQRHFYLLDMTAFRLFPQVFFGLRGDGSSLRRGAGHAQRRGLQLCFAWPPSAG